MYRAESIIQRIVFISCVFLALAGILFYLGHEGKIIIEKPYKAEYKETLDALGECKMSKIPNCAPCECKEGAWGIMLSIMGFIWMITGFVTMSLANRSQKKPEKKK